MLLLINSIGLIALGLLILVIIHNNNDDHFGGNAALV